MKMKIILTMNEDSGSTLPNRQTTQFHASELYLSICNRQNVYRKRIKYKKEGWVIFLLEMQSTSLWEIIVLYISSHINVKLEAKISWHNVLSSGKQRKVIERKESNAGTLPDRWLYLHKPFLRLEKNQIMSR